MKTALKTPAHLAIVRSRPKQVVAPKHLCSATKRWFIAVCQLYDLEEHHVRLLTLACQAWDRAEEAREALAADGLTTRDRYGTLKPHPLLAVERDCRTGFARLLRELDLDADEPPESSRPPSILSNRRGRS